jgi:hypothetical protein
MMAILLHLPAAVIVESTEPRQPTGEGSRDCARPASRGRGLSRCSSCERARVRILRISLLPWGEYLLSYDLTRHQS